MIDKVSQINTKIKIQLKQKNSVHKVILTVKKIIKHMLLSTILLIIHSNNHSTNKSTSNLIKDKMSSSHSSSQMTENQNLENQDNSSKKNQLLNQYYHMNMSTFQAIKILVYLLKSWIYPILKHNLNLNFELLRIVKPHPKLSLMRNSFRTKNLSNTTQK